MENGRSHAFAALNELVPSMRPPSLKNSAETPTRLLNLSGLPSSAQSTPGSTPRDRSNSLPPTPRDPRDRSNSLPPTPRDLSSPSIPTTPSSTPSTTPRDISAVEEIEQTPSTPVSPYKSLWSTVFGFAFGPFASCVIPRCLPKHAESEEEGKEENDENKEKSTTPNGTNTTPMKSLSQNGTSKHHSLLISVSFLCIHIISVIGITSFSPSLPPFSHFCFRYERNKSQSRGFAPRTGR